MHKFIISLIFAFFFVSAAKSQVLPGTSYYKDEYLTKEAEKEKAKWSKTIVINPDSSTTFEVKNIKSGAIKRRETYMGNEPWGIWIETVKSKIIEIDYNFELVYYDSAAQNVVPNSENLQVHSTRLKHQLNKFENDLINFINANLFYHPYAKVNKIKGKVTLSFVISSTGNIEEIKIMQGVNLIFDKEAYRVVRLYGQINNPIKTFDQTKISFNLPLNFR